MPARRQILEELEQLQQLPGLPPRLARLLATLCDFARAPRDDSDPYQLRRDVFRVCEIIQAEYGQEAIPLAERMVQAMNNAVHARLILTALRRRARADARGVAYTD